MMSGGSSTDTREAVALLSEKDKKIAELKRQLNNLRTRNVGLENCVKNQDSAVRKIGSLVVSPRSTQSSDCVTADEIEDVIDDVYRKIRRMEDIDSELSGFARGARKNASLRLTGEVQFDGRTGYTRKDSTDSQNENIGHQDFDDKRPRQRGFNSKVKKAESDIFAAERAFRQIAKDKNFDEKMLNVRLEQLRAERDTLYDIIKQYEPILFHVGEDAAQKVERRNKDAKHSPKRLEIEATVTLQNNGEAEKEELLYHIEELRKCLLDIKEYKSRRRPSDIANERSHLAPRETEAGFNTANGLEIRNGGHQSIRGENRGQRNENAGGLKEDSMRPSGLGGLEKTRRMSLTAEKPGVLIDSDINEGNHVTRLFSNRIKELEEHEVENKKMIGQLREELKTVSAQKAEVMKDRDRLLGKVQGWVESGPRRKGKDDESQDMVAKMDTYLHGMKEDLLNSKIHRDDLENELWKAKNVLQEETRQRNEVEKELLAARRKEVESRQKQEVMGDSLNESKRKIKELEKTVEEEKINARDIETEAKKLEMALNDEAKRGDAAESKKLELEHDLEEEKENSSVFRKMLQEIEKAKKNVEEDLKLVKLEYEKSIRNNAELKGVLQNEKEHVEELQKKQAVQDEEFEGARSELNMTLKEMEDLKHRLKRTEEDLAIAEKLKPSLEEAQNKNSHLLRRESMLENELAATKIKLHSISEKNAQLEGLMDKWKDDLSKANSTINELEGMNKVLNKGEESLKRKIAAVSLELDDVTRNSEILQSKLNLRNEELIKEQREKAKKNEELQKIKGALIEKEKELEATWKQVNESERENELLNAELVEAKNERNRMKIKTEEDEDAFKVFEMEIKSLRLLTETLESEKNDLQEQLKTKGSEISKLIEMQASLTNERDVMKEELEIAKQEAVENEGMILEANKILESKDDRLRKEEKKVRKLENEIADMENEIKQLVDVNEKLRKDEEVIKKRLDSSQNEFKGLQKSLEKSWKEKEGLQGAIEKLQNDKKETADELNIIQKVVEQKDKEISIFETRELEKEKRISELVRGTEELQNQLLKAHGDLKKKEEKHSQLEMRMFEKEEQLKTQRFKNNSLLENISQKNKEIDQLRDKIKDAIEKGEAEQSNITKRLKLEMELLKSKHESELMDIKGKHELCQEYMQSLRKQVEGYKQREIKFQKNGSQMKEEFGKLTNELQQAKMILRDFQTALLDKDNDLKKINDAVLLLENAHATREAGLHSKILSLQNEIDALNKESSLVQKELRSNEDYVAKLKDEKEELIERLKNDEKILKDLHEENSYLHDDMGKFKRELARGNEALGRKERETEELNEKIIQDGLAVEELMEHLEGTLGDVRQQLAVVEDEKINLKALMDNDKLKLKEFEDDLKDAKQELLQKEEDLMLEKAKSNSLQKQLRNTENANEDKKKIADLKSDLFKIGREKQAAIVNLTKERDEAILQKTAEKMAKDNVKLQMKNMKDEVEKMKKIKQDKDKEFDRYVEELKRRLVKSREREKEAVRKEADYREKLKEMSETIRMLERRIEDAVYMAEEEKKKREEILAHLLLPMEEMGMKERNEAMIDADHWKQRVSNLHRNIEDFKHQFSKFKSTAVADGVAYKDQLESKRSEEMHDLKRELDSMKKEKSKLQDRMQRLNSEVDLLADKKEKITKDNNRLSEELRLARQEAMIQKHELDWLRDTIGRDGAQKKSIDLM